MNKTDKIIFYSIFIIPVCLLFCFFFWSIFFDKTTQEIIKEHDLSENFRGKVERLYFDKENHNVKVAVLSTGYKYEVSRLWESKVKVGDSIIKKKGSFELIIYRDNNLKTILDYRDTYKKE